MCPQISSVRFQLTRNDNFSRLNDPLADYKCNSCFKILENPCQRACQCRYCFKCLSKSIIFDKCINCCQSVDEKVVIKDKTLENEIQNKDIVCVKCKWNGKLNKYDFHECGSGHEQVSAENDHIQSTSQKQEIDVYDELNVLHKKMEDLKFSCKNLSVRMRLLENSSHNGEKIIKIDNVKNKLDDASRNATTIDSDPFYTSRNGYKICGRIVFNLNPQDKQVYLSVFIVIMKGEFDALLEWPFKQRITFMIIDQLQTEHSENIIDSFKPNPNSNSFQKPISDMNIASGISLFCSIGRLNSADHEYIKDDTMFVKIIVDRRYLHEI